MANLTVAAETCVALGATEHQFESFPGRDIALGALTVTRVLPVKGKRLVGPWCFLDRFGPLTFADPSPMDVGAHPHMGLQTVTWLLDGELVHYDSLGYESLLRPGGVNVMTSGAAIAHAIAASKGSRCRSECCTTLGPIVPRCVSPAGLGADYY